MAERDVVLTYALAALSERATLDHLAFKGGTCLRKVVFGSNGRFSDDLDFTIRTDLPEEDVLAEVVDAFDAEFCGIAFKLDEYYKTEDDTSFGAEVLYRHAWNEEGRFRLQVSLRERPTLRTWLAKMRRQAYFEHLEFRLFQIPSLSLTELIAEKIRAAFKRTKVRDVYDLYLLAKAPFDCHLLRQLAVLKLWQVRDPFDPDSFFRDLRSGNYDWSEIERLVRSSERVKPDEILATVESRYGALRQLTDLESKVISDSKAGWNEPLANRLRAEIRSLATR